ncbi:MAG: SGNH/GDSL hydrolase family protein [Nocardioides sp.]|uniref:SGNH/GDSL hydrolase family protein n=1 Tax=Nocardioides sp. TaxID=35761 RepID=UPI0039E65C4A
MRAVRAWISCALAVLIAGTVLAACGNDDRAHHAANLQPEVAQSICATYRARAAQRLALVTGHGPRVVVIGDSWSVGRHLPSLRLTWPVYLHGRVHVSAFPGSGFAERDMARCGQVSFADRAANALRQGASLVVVEGGINDVGRSTAAITSGFRRLMHELAGYRVVIVGPARAPRRGNAVFRVDRLLHRLAERAGVDYIRTLDLTLTYLPDRLHPTVAGHRIFGRTVARRIAALGRVQR